MRDLLSNRSTSYLWVWRRISRNTWHPDHTLLLLRLLHCCAGPRCGRSRGNISEAKQMTSGSIWNPSGRRSGRWPGAKCCGSAAALAVNVSQVEVLSTSLRWATADHALEHRQIICWMRLEWELYFHSNNKTFEIKCGVLRFILNLHPNKRSIWRANLCIVFMFQKHVLSIQSVM